MDTKPEIIISGWAPGDNNTKPRASQIRVNKAKPYRDHSTVMVMPTRGVIPARVVDTMLCFAAPMNQRYVRLLVAKMEVGAAYTAAQELIRQHLADYRYVLTWEEDNLPPADGLLRLIATIEEERLDVISGLYWLKGPGGYPMIYGKPGARKGMRFAPQAPSGDVQRCNGTGMGFALWKTPVFLGLEFVTVGQGAAQFTQDLYAYNQAIEKGVPVACAVDNRIKVGHLDPASGRVW